MDKREQFLRVLILAAPRLGWTPGTSFVGPDVTVAEMDAQCKKAFHAIHEQLAASTHETARSLGVEAWLSIYDTMNCMAPGYDKP